MFFEDDGTVVDETPVTPTEEVQAEEAAQDVA